jgi:HEAT repeat protein
MNINSLNGARVFVCLTLLLASLAPARAPANDTDLDRAVEALVNVLGDPEAGGERLEETNRAINALLAIGRPAVPKLIDAVLGDNTNAWVYAGYTLKQMRQVEVYEPLRERWGELTAAQRWRLVPYVADAHFSAVVELAFDGLTHADASIRKQAWGFIIERRQAQALAPARDRFFQALEGDEFPSVRWCLLTDAPVFDAEREADILIALLRPDSWAARGVDRVLPSGGTPPWWPDGRELIVPILGSRNVRRAGPALVTLLAEKGPGRAYLGHLIIPILGQFSEREAIPELKRIIETPSGRHEPTLWGRDYLHVLAASALMQLGDPLGRTRCEAFLQSQESLANTLAATAFAQYGTQDDLDILARLLDHEMWYVRRDVCRGLERITGLVNRAPGWSVTTENDAPLWKEWLRSHRRKTERE